MAQALEAFFCLIQQPAWVPWCLRGDPAAPDPMPHAVNLHAVIIHTSEQVTAQLTAGACLTQLCKAEEEYYGAQPGLRMQNPYCRQARSDGCMPALVDVMDKAVQVARCSVTQHMLCLDPTAG